MEIKTAEKIANIYKKIQQHHEDLITLNGLLEFCLKNEQGLNLSLKNYNVSNTSYDSCSDSNIFPSGIWGKYYPRNEDEDFATFKDDKTEEKKLSFSTEINDILSIEMLGVLIREKERVIESYIKQLNNG